MRDRMRKSRFIFVRHGPVAQAPGRDPVIYDGQATLGPIDSAWAQAVRAKLPADPPPDFVYCSAMRRTFQTWQRLCEEGYQSPTPVALPGLNEHNFGAWHGQPQASVPWIEDARSYVRLRPPGGETYEELCQRVDEQLQTLEAAAAAADPPGQSVLILAHAGTIRAALGRSLALPPFRCLSLAVDLLSVSEIVLYYDDRGEVVCRSVQYINR